MRSRRRNRHAGIQRSTPQVIGRRTVRSKELQFLAASQGTEVPYYKRSCTCDDLTAPLASDCCGGIRVADGYFSTLGWSPLDAALGLPAGENSYVLEDWLERLCVKEAYGESVADLRAWLGTTVSVRTAEGINRHLADYSEGFRLNQGTPAPQEDE